MNRDVDVKECDNMSHTAWNVCVCVRENAYFVGRVCCCHDVRMRAGMGAVCACSVCSWLCVLRESIVWKCTNPSRRALHYTSGQKTPSSHTSLLSGQNGVSRCSNNVTLFKTFIAPCPEPLSFELNSYKRGDLHFLVSVLQ